MRLSIIKALSGPEFVHEIISLCGGSLVSEVQALGVNVTVVEVGGFRVFSLPKIVSVAQKFDPDIIHSLPWVPNFFSRTVLKFFLPRAKIICDFHGTAHMGLMQHFLDKYSFGLAHRWLFVSQEVRRHFCNQWGISCDNKNFDNNFFNNKFLVLPNFINQHEFSSNPNTNTNTNTHTNTNIKALALFKRNENDFILGIAARLEPVKRLPMLLEYFTYFKKHYLGSRDIKLCIAGGGGPQEDELRTLALHLGIAQSIIFENLRLDQMSAFYHTLDAFVLCSESEGQPLVLMEAAASGIPILLSSNLSEQNNLFIPNSPVSYFTSKEEFKLKIFEIMQKKPILKCFLKPSYFQENAAIIYDNFYKSL